MIELPRCAWYWNGSTFEYLAMRNDDGSVLILGEVMRRKVYASRWFWRARSFGPLAWPGAETGIARTLHEAKEEVTIRVLAPVRLPPWHRVMSGREHGPDEWPESLRRIREWVQEKS